MSASERRIPLFAPVVLACCLFWNGCSVLPFYKGPDLSKLGPYEVISGIERNFSGINDLSDRAMMYMDLGGLRHRSEAILLYRNPNLMKIEINGPIGMGLITTVIRGDFISVHFRGNDQLIEFEGNETLSEFIGTAFSPEELIPFLLGFPDFSTEDLDKVSDFKLDDGNFILSIVGDNVTRRIVANGRKLTITKEEILTSDGELIVSRELSRYISSDGVMLPNSVRIWRDEGSVRINFLSRKVNLGLSRSDFAIRLPDRGD